MEIMLSQLEAITTLLGEKELETLKFFVKKAQECGSQHLAWNPKEPKIYKMADCDVEFDRQEFERRHPAVEALASLRFVSFRPAGDVNIRQIHLLTIYPAAIYRVEHEERNRLGKWLEIQKLRYKETMGVTAFFVSIVLAAFQILQIMSS